MKTSRNLKNFEWLSQAKRIPIIREREGKGREAYPYNDVARYLSDVFLLIVYFIDFFGNATLFIDSAICEACSSKF